jgi:hypothetical protein
MTHCNLEGKLVGGGSNNLLTTLQGYTIKFNPAIDHICKQPLEKLEVIKEALELGG